MKKLVLLISMLIFSIGFSQSYSEDFNASLIEDTNGFEPASINDMDLSMFDIESDMNSGDITFNASEKIDYINIYNSHQEEIFSAKGTIIENNKINISFLPAGTYYLEVVIGKDMGAHELIKP
jgi:hypothetical protein